MYLHGWLVIPTVWFVMPGCHAVVERSGLACSDAVKAGLKSRKFRAWSRHFVNFLRLRPKVQVAGFMGFL